MPESSKGLKQDAEPTASVKSRIAEAKSGVVSAENDLKALSAKRLAALKQLPASRVARLDVVAELTPADEKELRAWLAGRTKASDPEARTFRPWSRGGRRKLPDVRLLLAGATGLLVLVAVAIGWARTPTNYQVLRSETAVTIVAGDGSLESNSLPGGSVVIRDHEDPSRQMFDGRFWVRSEGYRSVTVYVGS